MYLKIKVFKICKLLYKDEDSSEFGPIVENCKTFLTRWSDVSVGWVRRSSNEAARCTARSSWDFSDFYVWENFSLNIVVLFA